MRLRGFTVNAFGRLADFAAADLGDAPVVVLLGDNESGKTTFFEFVTTALFGFKPARRDLHPYDPWTGAFPEGSLDLRLADGTDVTVRRRLRSSPDGRLVVPDGEEKIANHPVPWVGRLEREVYRGLHALSIHEADDLGDEVWKELEERLLGGAAFPFLRPARAVAADLETEAGALWRDDRRGKPRSKQIEADIRDLRREREEAAARDRRIREIQGEKVATDERLAEVRQELVRTRTQIELAGRIASARQEAARLEQRLERCRATAALDPAQRALLESAEAVEELAEERASDRADRAARDALRKAVEAEARRVAEGGGILPESLSEESTRRLADLDLAALEGACQDAGDAAAALGRAQEEKRKAGERRDTAARRAEQAPDPAELVALESRIADLERLFARERDAADTDRPSAARPDRLPAILVGVLAAILLLVGLLVADARAALLAVGGVLALLAAWLFVRAGASGTLPASSFAREREELGLGPDDDVRAELEAARRKRIEARQREVPPGELKEAQAALAVAEERHAAAQVECDRRRDAALGLLEGIPVSDERLDRPGGALVATLLVQRDARRALANAERALRDVEARMAARRERVSDVAAALGRSVEGEPFDVVKTWAEELSALGRLRDQEAARREEIPDLEAELARAREAEGGAASELAQIGLADAESVLDTLARVELDQRLESLRSEQETLNETAGALRTEERHLAADQGVDQVDGEISALEEELQAAARERDRLVLLANVFREAHARYRERHQPDVFRRASGYVRIVTAGRYETLEVADEEGEQFLEVRAAGNDYPLRVGPPLSRGTREQIHLAIRLALADHVDGDEPLPLVLDELFVNWDPDRTGRGLGVLRDLGERRQILLMTCHPEFADRARAEAGAVVVRMPGTE